MSNPKKNPKVNEEPENVDPNVPPKQEYLDQLQQDAIHATIDFDPTEGEKIIRQGLQAWPNLIDAELQRFKQQFQKK